MKIPPDVGIVILTYNSEKYIQSCLDSILKSKYSSCKCIVVDNDSTDKTQSIVKYKYPKLKLIKNKSNLGYAAGNNVGIRHLLKNENVSYILILNPDTLISPNLIKECVSVMEANKEIGIIGPVITYAQDPDRIWYSGGYINRLFLYTKHLNMNKIIKLTNAIKKQHSSSSSEKYSDQSSRFTSLARTKSSNVVASTIINTDFITGACMMVKIEVFEKVGLLPEDYFMYFEDVDFCQMAINKGFKCNILMKPLVRHHVSGSSDSAGTNDLTPAKAYYFARNPFIYIKRNVRGFKKVTNYLGQFLIRLPYYSIDILKSGNYKAILYYYWGIYKGIKFK